MAVISNAQVRLTPSARWLLVTAAVMARLHMRLPHRVVKWIVDRSWQIRFGEGPWVRGRRGADGRLYT